MKKIAPLIIFASICLLVPYVSAEPTLTINLSPEPQFNQVWAYETYLVNMSVIDLNLSRIDLSGYTGDPSMLYFDGDIRLRGKGHYDFGDSAAGYTRDLEKINLEQNVLLDDSFLFNLTLDKDTYEYGMLPFETIEITLRFDVYLRMSDDSLGPKLVSRTQPYIQIDETQIAYIEGKYMEMEDEINSAINAAGLDSFNRERYTTLLEAINNSLTLGDYVIAFDTWIDYDDDDRTDMIHGLTRASDAQFDQLQSLEDQLEEAEDRLEEAENSIAILELEYNQLESTYNTLSNTYRKVNAELDAAKRNLTTSITAVFLTAIVFYFIGQRGIGRGDAE